MTVDPLGPLRQTLYATTLADLANLVSAKDVVRGAVAVAADQNYAPYVALPDTVVAFPGTQLGKGVNWVPIISVIGAVAESRTISTMAPLQGGGALSSNLSLSIDAATTSAVGVVKLSGDLAGTATSVSVAKIKGTAVATAGGALGAGKVLATTGSATCDWVDPNTFGIVTGTGTVNVLAKFGSTSGITNSSVSDDGSTVDFANGILRLVDHALGSATSAGIEVLQAFAGQLVARAASEYIDYAVTPFNLAASSSKAPKIGQQASQYTLTAPGTSTFTISPAIMSQLMQANRSMYGLLLCTQRVEATATTGWAGIYLIEAHTDGSGDIGMTAVNIVLVGTCGGAGPVVTVSASGAANFTLSIANTFSGTLTGMWHLLYGHCGS